MLSMEQMLFLITVLVVEFGEGIPVAWPITNSEDKAHLVAFLTALKVKVGEIHNIHVFMSDDAQQYFNAWSDVLRNYVLGMLTGHGEKF